MFSHVWKIVIKLLTEKSCDNMMSSWQHSQYIEMQIKFFFLPVTVTRLEFFPEL